MKETKMIIMQWAAKIEEFSGIQCANIRQLDFMKDSLKKFQEARDADKLYFKGLINDLELML